jgi:hypothetical protein
MFSIRRLITSSGSCKAIQNTYSLRRAAFSTSTTIRQEVSDLSSQPLSKTTTPTPLPANYRPLQNLDRSIPKEPFTQLVSLQNLPETATKEDILRLARQAFHDPEAPIKESKLKVQVHHDWYYATNVPLPQFCLFVIRNYNSMDAC